MSLTREEQELIETRNRIEQLEYLEARYGELDDEYDEQPSFVKAPKGGADKPKPKGKPKDKQRRLPNDRNVETR